MGYRMQFEITDKGQPFLSEGGLLNERNWQFFKALEVLLNNQPVYYNSKAELTSEIVNPSDRQRAYIVDVGAVRYKLSIADWVLESDDTTVI